MNRFWSVSPARIWGLLAMGASLGIGQTWAIEEGSSVPLASVETTAVLKPGGVFIADAFFQKHDGGLAGISAAANSPAIVGEGFFEILMADGTLAYTRNGAFRLTGSGRFVTSGGLTVLSGLQAVPPDATGMAISPHGELAVATASGVYHFRITLVRFQNAAGLLPIGADLFRETMASGPPETGNAGENGFGELGNGFLQLPGSFGFVVYPSSGRNHIEIEASEDQTRWNVVASIIAADTGKVFVRDLAASRFKHRCYRVRSKPLP